MSSKHPSLAIDWEGRGGTVPAVVQDSETLEVQRVGHMDAACLRATLETNRVHLLEGNKPIESPKTRVTKVLAQQEADGLLILVQADGSVPKSAFSEAPSAALGFLSELAAVIDGRHQNRSEASYTSRLFDSGVDRMAQKVGEEAVEVVIASRHEDPKELLGESADLIFHLMVLLRSKGKRLIDVVDILRARHR